MFRVIMRVATTTLCWIHLCEKGTKPETKSGRRTSAIAPRLPPSSGGGSLHPHTILLADCGKVDGEQTFGQLFAMLRVDVVEVSYKSVRPFGDAV